MPLTELGEMEKACFLIEFVSTPHTLNLASLEVRLPQFDVEKQ
jgi:hypothetical protein